jgi:hypothetical protein
VVGYVGAAVTAAAPWQMARRTAFHRRATASHPLAEEKVGRLAAKP